MGDVSVRKATSRRATVKWSELEREGSGLEMLPRQPSFVRSRSSSRRNERAVLHVVVRIADVKCPFTHTRQTSDPATSPVCPATRHSEHNAASKPSRAYSNFAVRHAAFHGFGVMATHDTRTRSIRLARKLAVSRDPGSVRGGMSCEAWQPPFCLCRTAKHSQMDHIHREFA